MYLNNSEIKYLCIQKEQNIPRAYPGFIYYASKQNFFSVHSYVAAHVHVNIVSLIFPAVIYLSAFTHSAPGSNLTWQVCPWILSFTKSMLKKSMYYQNCCILSNNCHQLLPEIAHLQSCCHRTVETKHQSKACFAFLYSDSKWTADGALFILSHHLWSAWNCCCDVIMFGQDIEKAATLEIFIYWVRASLTCTVGRKSRCLT